jgi:thiamine biosynthesis protein ThiS
MGATLSHDSIEIFVNGERKKVAGNQSISELLRELHIESDRVAVELNKAIVRRADWASTSVPPGAALEIVQFVGGG